LNFESIFAPYYSKMQAEKINPAAIRNFRFYLKKLVDGEQGLIPDSDIAAVESLPDADSFGPELQAIGQAALKHTIAIKLNGGLGTGMGLDRAKSLLEVRNNLSFLDIICKQVVGDDIPLLLMNSFSTQDDSLEVLAKYPALKKWGLSLDFLQNKVPKIRQSDFAPATNPQNPSQEWCPPGHGDLYTALLTSGMLDELISKGYQYAFVSNSDNLGADLSRSLLGYFVSNQLPFMLEAADRTEADKKGGHLALSLDGQLLLRESAQCPKADQASFQNIAKYKFFNTNNLWFNLRVLKEVLEQNEGVLGLPMICNSKTVDPRDSKSDAVFQLETAMGSAIATFKGAGAVRVPRTRFAPVKSTSDLLTVRSDACVLTSDFRVMINPERSGEPPVVNLDPDFYKLTDEMEMRFPKGVPSLIQCDSFEVRGDVLFGGHIQVRGQVKVVNSSKNQVKIPDGTVLEGLVDLGM
jgi:UDP-N-acetylglucosamine pyrophosphorylase